jgi:uncharacterized membrane protein
MSILGIALVVLGIVAMAGGYARARGPWARYQALKAQEANIARYESWRGGLRDTGPTGASVAMDLARGQARNGAIVMAVGFAITIAGFLVP